MVTPLATFDYTALSVYYTSGVSLSTGLQTAVLRNKLKDVLDQAEQKVIPPWRQAQAVETRSLEQRVFSNKPLIDPNDPLFDRNDLDDDSKTLFAAYKAINVLIDIKNYAQTSEGKLKANLVDSKFQARLDELRTFINNASTNTVSLVTGVLEDSLDSSIVLDQVEDAPTFYGATILENRNDPIPGLNPTDQFTVQADDGTTVRSVTITMSDISADPNDYTLDNISAHVNSELINAGISSLLYTERYSENEYGFRIDVGFGETVTLSANAATESSAVYLAGYRGLGPSGSGFVSKLDDLGTADPTEVFYHQIDTTGQGDNANAVAVDSTGAVYVVGRTAGDLGSQAVDPDNNDAYLNKYDAAGNLVFTQRLGATEDGGAFAVAVDGNDNVIVTGQVRGKLTTTAYGGNLDTFVTKYDSTGAEQWTRQAGPFLDDLGLSLAVNASNEIYVAGLARSEIAVGEGYAGGDDAYVTKLDADGNLVYNRQFGDAGDERHNAVAVDGAGNVYLAGTDDGVGFVRRYGDGDATALDWKFTGTLGSDGDVTGITVDSDGDVYVTGYTANTNFFSGSEVTAHAGSTDGFVAKLGNADGALAFGTFLGTAADDRGFGVAVDPTTEEVYVSGETAGTLAGETSSGLTDGFVIKLDATFNETWRHQFGGGYDQRAGSIAFDANGTSILSRFGLPTGEVPPDVSDQVSTVSTARAGQYFYVSVDNGPLKQVELGADDSFGFLSFRIRQAIGTGAGSATFIDDDIAGRFLRVSAAPGHKVELIAGPDEMDALSGIGLRPIVLFGEVEDDGSEDFVQTTFGLGITDNANLLTDSAIEDAQTLLEFAQVTVQKAYRLKTQGPDPEFEFPEQPPQRILQQISSMEAALQRLQAVTASANAGAQLLSSGQGSLFNLLT